MNIAIATSAEPKDRYKDIQLLIAALEEMGATGEKVIWDRPEVNWAAYDAVLIDSTWDYTEKPDTFLKWCQEASNKSLLVNPLEIIRHNYKKEYLLTLAQAGLNVPHTSIIKATSSIEPHTLPKNASKIVVKPVIGAGGSDTLLFDNLQDALGSSVFMDMLKTRNVLMQTYVPEIETLGEVGAVFIADRLSHCVLKKPGDDDFRVQYQYGGTTTLIEPPDNIQNLYQQVTAVLRVRPTYMRLDFVPTTIPTIMEVEMVEPDKYFSIFPKAAKMLASALLNKQSVSASF
ncbi:MAG TPA: hypothetical protein VFN56_01945 [Candidatus Saccharimonadales bacterium]|nr:hypothetical protein [Candidatus Saccharimonadales bacterium]